MNVKGGPLFAAILFLIGVSTAFSASVEALIVVPFERDIACLKKHWRFVGQPVEIAGRAFYKAVIEGKTVAVTVTKAGLSETTLTCDVALLSLKAKRVISIGVAGALVDRYQPGDIVCVDSIACHERGAHDAREGFKSSSRRDMVHLDPVLERLQTNLRQLAQENTQSVHSDGIVSGNSFIASSAKREELATSFDSGLVDMNSSGIAESCQSLDRPYCVIRIVSDYANETAQDDFNAFCNEAEHMDQFWSLFLQAFDAIFKEKI